MSGVFSLVLGIVSFLSISIAATPVTPFGFSDIALGQSVTALIKAHGAPDVVTTDVGQVWTWDTGGDKVRVTTDDSGIVHLFDVLPSPKKQVSFPLAMTPPLLLNFGVMTLPEAQGHLKAMTDFSAYATFPDTGAKAAVQAYNITPATEAILLFDDPAQTLREAFYGERPYLVRDGLLPAGTSPKAPHFTAPVIIHQGAADYPATKQEGDAYIRLAVDKNGAVTDATMFVSSGDTDLDRAALAGGKMYTFKPATLDGMPVASVFFHKETFRTLRPHS
ncbi:MAG: energy transducer TonB [Candidatus Eremiobacteraeota bacterium]|nr:energy transducer TonB [Candidatus Eremiobacteraeota bacterium]